MKNKQLKKILVIAILIISLTGCTKLLKDDNNKVIRNEKTGQTITENIICKPKNEETIKIYKENKVDIDKLPDCDNIKIGGKYENIWNSIFVRPLAYIIINIGKLVKSKALSIIIVTIILRTILYPMTKKSLMQSENMKKANPEIKRIEEKYAGKTDNESMTKKGQEMMGIYKKYNINPLSGCLFAFIQIPILIAFYEAINRVPAIFEDTLFGLNMGTTPSAGITSGAWYYIFICIILIIVTFLSYKLNPSMSTGNSDNPMGNPKTMGIVMTVFIGFMSFTLPTAIAFYWIVSSLFTIIQNFAIRGGKKE